MTEAQAPAVGAIASTVRADIIEYKAGKRRTWRPKSNAASLLGHPCSLETGRYLYLKRKTETAKLTLYPVQRQFLFDDGNAIEDQVLADLRAAGHQVDRTQASFDWDQYQISGKIDGFIYVNGQAYPLEIKAMSPSLFRAAEKAAENQRLTWARIRNQPWLAKYAVQLNTYLLMTGRELGLFVFKNRDSGDIAIYEWALDYDIGELTLKRAEAINAALAGTGPEPGYFSLPSFCGKCEMAHICLPPAIQYGETMEIMDNPELEARLKQREALEAAHRDWIRLDAQTRDACRGRIGICGDYEIGGAWAETEARTVPEHTEPPRRTWRRKIRKWRKEE